MLFLLSAVLIVLLAILSLIHFYWSVGGKKGIELIIPENKEGRKASSPSRLLVFLIGFSLLLMALFTYMKVFPGHHFLPAWLYENGMIIIAAVFFLRTIGDFRYVGFFKQIRHSAFAEMDSYYYTPAAVFICVLALIVEVL